MTAPEPRPSRTGGVFSDSFLHHNAALPHPESPARLQAIRDALRHADILPLLRPVDFREATSAEVERVHSATYHGLLDRAEGQWLDSDTHVGPGSPQIARLAAGGVMSAVREVWQGRIANAFCAVRPPGHHALSERGMGFCLLNNIAIAAANLLGEAPDARVLIVDWDVHHGNGTQAIFYDSAQVMYASIHQYPFYPGTGAADETGHGPGLGLTVNRPLRAGAGAPEFLDALDAILGGPARRFAPDIVLVSAGFDAHRDDPLAQLEVTTPAFGAATDMVCSFACDVCSGRLVSVLEGGYDLAALGDSVAAHVRALVEAGQSAGAGKDSS